MSRSILGNLPFAALAPLAFLGGIRSQVPPIAFNTRTTDLTATADYFQLGPTIGDCRPAATVNGRVFGCNIGGILYDFWAVANLQSTDHYILWKFERGLRSVTDFQLITLYSCSTTDLHRILHFSLDYTTDPNPSLSSTFTPLTGASLAGAANTIRENEVTVAAPGAVQYLISFPRLNATGIRLHSYPFAGFSNNRNFVITEVSFQTGAPVLADPRETTVAAAPAIVSALGGRSLITVVPRDQTRTRLGAGIPVVLATTGGTLQGSVLDLGEGTYTQVLIANPAAIGATVSATVQGVPISNTAEVFFVVVDPGQTTVAAAPAIVSASDGCSLVTVVPKGPSGARLGTGLAVVLATTGGTLQGSVLDLGDGTYTQVLVADTHTPGAAVSATVQGVPIANTAAVVFVVVDAGQTTVAAAPAIISASDGRSMVTVVPKDTSGASLGTGLDVVLATTGGTLLGAVVDQADGTYTQVLAADTGAAGATLSATVQGVPIANTAAVVFVFIDPGQTTVAAAPSIVSANGGRSVITVVPKDAGGLGLGAGLTVILVTTGGTLEGSVVDQGNGTYAQVLVADMGAAGATVSATVLGVPITNTATVVFRSVGTDLTTVAAAPAVVSSFAGRSTVTVVPKDALGANLGAGLVVVLATTGGTLQDSVVDLGDGTYVQVLSADPSASGAMLSATVEGFVITHTASVRFVAVDPSQSTITVSPEATYLGGRAVVTVVPRDDRGIPVTGVRTVVIQATLADLVGSVVAGAGGTYTQTLNATAVGTASVTASVDGLPLEVSGALAVLDPAALGVVIGLRADETVLGYASIQHAVNRVAADRLVRILVTPGTYDEVVRISGKTRLSIEGMGMGQLAPVVVRALRIERCADLRISGLVVEPAGGHGCRGHGSGIVFAGGCRASSRVTVQGCMVTGARNNHAGIVVRRGNDAVAIVGCLVEGCGGDGIALPGDGSAQISECIVRGNGRNGIHVDSDVTVGITSCRIENNGLDGDKLLGYGILRARAPHGGNPRAITLTHNVISGNRGKIVAGRSDANIGNRDQVLDPTDSQP